MERVSLFFVAVIFTPIHFALSLAFLNLSEESRKARKGLVIVSFIVLALIANPNTIERFQFITVASGEGAHELLVTVFGAISAYGVLYFFGQLLRDVMMKRHEDLDRPIKPPKSMASTVSYYGDEEKALEADDRYVKGIEEMRWKDRLWSSVPYVLFTVVVEIGFPIWIGLQAAYLSRAHVIALWDKLAPLLF